MSCKIYLPAQEGLPQTLKKSEISRLIWKARWKELELHLFKTLPLFLLLTILGCLLQNRSITCLGQLFLLC